MEAQTDDISSVLAFAKLAFSYASLSKSSSVVEAPFASFCSKLKTATFAASLAIFIWPNTVSVCAFLASSSRISLHLPFSSFACTVVSLDRSASGVRRSGSYLLYFFFSFFSLFPSPEDDEEEDDEA